MFLCRLSISLLIIVINLFAACGKNYKRKHLDDGFFNNNQESSQKDLDDEIGQAKNLDIPIPLGYTYVTCHSYDQTKHLVYNGILSVTQAKTFYLQEMERLGWDIKNLSTDQEALLFCSKINKMCALSIRSCLEQKQNHKKIKSSVHLFIREKTLNQNSILG